jgi:hypothetical protein
VTNTRVQTTSSHLLGLFQQFHTRSNRHTFIDHI